jgi:hypothetical protein
MNPHRKDHARAGRAGDSVPRTVSLMDTHSDEGLLVETRGLTNDSVSAPPSTTSTCAFLQGRLRPARAQRSRQDDADPHPARADHRQRGHHEVDGPPGPAAARYTAAGLKDSRVLDGVEKLLPELLEAGYLLGIVTGNLEAAGVRTA